MFDSHAYLGSPSYRWSGVYAAVGNIVTSDRAKKKNIQPLTEQHLKFLSLLKPVSYQFIDGTSGRTHIGFISQDVEEAMKKVGLTDLDFAGFCKDQRFITEKTYEKRNVPEIDPLTGEEYLVEKVMPTYVEKPVLDQDGNPEYIYSLRYDEFMALNTYAIQFLLKKQFDK